MNTTRSALACMLLLTWALVAFGCEAPEDSAKRTAGDKRPDARGLKVGDQAPDFQVEVSGGESFRLSKHLLQAKGPTVLLFDRAHW